MSKILVVVESPGKVKKIQSILGSKYTVTASVGHIIDLPAKSISVDIQNQFKPDYKPCSGKARKVITQLKQMYSKSNDLLLATDEDREGEMIGWSVAHVLGVNNPKRIVFNSITKDEIIKAVKSPKSLDYNMVNAAKARRILDRIVGYELSPILWSNIKFGLSAGRVQSVVARLIVDKEREIEEFFSKGADSYFKFKADFDGMESVLYDLTGKNKNGTFKGKVTNIKSENESRKFLQNAIESSFTVEHIFDKKSIRSPSAPFTTSTLQQESSRKLGYSVVKTMRAAQVLYEAGLITYMRTDSINLSNEAIKNISDYVLKTYGKEYYNKKVYKTKSKNTQEAHEAIRPTNVFTTDAAGKGTKIGNSEIRLYELIWKRTVASQMKSAEFNITSIQLSISKDDKHFFQSSTEELIFPGFLKVYNLKNLEDNEEKKENKGKIPKKGETLNPKNITGTEEFTKPPSRYNEASLINKLDPKNLNIGRPATYASMIDVVQRRGYVEKSDVDGITKDSLSLIYKGKGKKIEEKKKKITIGKEKNKFVPTTLGKLVNDFLVKEFSTIMDYKFTSKMEGNLDDIADGSKIWHKVLEDFYKKFHPNIEKLKGKSLVNDKYTRDLGKDPETGYQIVATMGRYGEMIKLCGPTDSKSKYAPIKKPLTIENIKLSDALKLFEFPKELGKFERKKVLLQRGKHGLYIKLGKEKGGYQIDDYDENITLEQAIECIKKGMEKRKGLGQFISETKIYTILDGKFGKYIKIIDKKKTKGKGTNVSLPKNTDIESLTLEKLQEIVNNHYNKPKYKKPTKAKKVKKGK